MSRVTSVLLECTSLLRALESSSEKFSEVQHRTVRRLCERTGIFLPIIIDLQDPERLKEKCQGFAGLNRLLESLVELLAEIKDFVEQDGSSLARKMVVNEEFRAGRVGTISAFYSRIHEVRNAFSWPEGIEAIEKRREEDFEDFQHDMNEMLESVLEELMLQRSNAANFKTLLHDMKDHCSNQHVGVLKKLIALEEKVSANKQISIADIGGELHAAMTDCLSPFFASLKTDLSNFKLLIENTQSALLSLKQTADESRVALIAEIEGKFLTFQAVSVREMEAFKKVMGEGHRDLIKQLEDQFSQLDLLSIGKDIQDVKTLLQELKDAQSGGDVRVATMLQQLEDKVTSSTKITKEELNSLRSHFSTGHEDAMRLLEAKLDALNLVSLQEAIGDLRADVALIQQQGNELLNGMNALKGLICKTMVAEDLSPPEETSRKTFLQQLRIPANTVSFESGKLLGKGGFGKVRLGYYRQTRLVAVKSILTKECELLQQDVEAFENEMLLMYYIGNHPNILTLYGYCKDESTGDLHIVLEYAPLNSLAGVLYDKSKYPNLSARLIMGWLCDLASALDHMHSRKIKHRDVKAENLLVFEDFRVKLCDFGLAKEHCVSRKTSRITGTDGFKAPEVLTGQGSFYGSDIYSWAMTAYQMFVRKPPIDSHSLEDKIKAIMLRLNQSEEVTGKGFHCAAFELLLWYCVELNHRDRPSANHVCNEVNKIKERVFEDDDRSHVPENNVVILQTQVCALQGKIDMTTSELIREKEIRMNENTVSEERRELIVELQRKLSEQTGKVHSFWNFLFASNNNTTLFLYL